MMMWFTRKPSPPRHRHRWTKWFRGLNYTDDPVWLRQCEDAACDHMQWRPFPPDDPERIRPSSDHRPQIDYGARGGQPFGYA